MGRGNWWSRLWTSLSSGGESRGPWEDPRQSLYPDFHVTALEVRRVLNASPVISPQTFAINENAELGDVVATVDASDPDPGDSLNFAIIGGNVGSAFAIHPTTGTITVFNPASLADGLSFEMTVEVTDPLGATDDAVITILVNPSTDDNDAPIINDQRFIVPAGSPSGTVVGQLLAADPDEGDTLTYSITAGNTGNPFAVDSATGIITVANANSVTTPLTRALTVQVVDAEGESDTATVRIRVNGDPTGLELSNTTISENELGGVVGSITVTDPNVDDQFTFALDDARFEITGGELKLKADESLDFAAEQTVDLRITVTDEGGASFAKVFEIEVVPVNVQPTDITLSNNTVEENAPGAVIGLVEVEDENPPNTPFGTHTFRVVEDFEENENESDRFFIDDEFQLRLFPEVSLNFEDNSEVNLWITATDNPPGEPSERESVTRMFTIQVIDVNDPPVANDKQFATLKTEPLNGNILMGGPGDEADYDEDGDPLTIVEINGAGVVFGELITLDSGASLTVYSNGDFRYDPNTSAELVRLQIGFVFDDAFTYRITDGREAFDDATVNIQVIGLNLPPTVNPEFSGDGMEDVPVVFTFDELFQLFGVEDVDTDEEYLRIKIFDVFDVAYRTVELTGGDGGPGTTFTIIPTKNFNGNLRFQYKVVDLFDAENPLNSNTGMGTIFLEPVDDPPTAEPDRFTLYEDPVEPFTGNVTLNDFDVDADPELNLGLLAMEGVNPDNLQELYGIVPDSVELVTPLPSLGDHWYLLPEGGQLRLLPNGDFTYIPADDFFGEEQFLYSIRDPQGLTGTAAVTLQVKPVNDPPTFEIELAGPFLELDPLNPTTLVLTNVTVGPANEAAKNQWFGPPASEQTIQSVTAMSSNPSFLPNLSGTRDLNDPTVWRIEFPVLPFRNEVLQLRISVRDTGGTNPGQDTTTQVVEVRVIVGIVPASSTQFVRSEPVTFPVLESIDAFPEPPAIPTVAIASLQEAATSSQSATRSERFVSVYLISSDGLDQLREVDLNIRLDPEILKDLRALFEILPDDRFRIYLHLEDGTRRLVLDVYVRDGKPFDPGDLVQELIVLPEVTDPSADQETLEVKDSDAVDPQGPGGPSNADGELDSSSERPAGPSFELHPPTVPPTEESSSNGDSSWSIGSTSDATVPRGWSAARWAAVAGGVAILGTQRQQRAAAREALAACVDRPLNRFARRLRCPTD